MKPFLLRGHEKPVTVVKFNYDGDLLFTGSAEKKVNLWYSISGERVGSFEPSAAVRTLDVTNDSRYLVVGTLVGTLDIFKVDGGQLLGSISMTAKILTVQFSFGDKKLLVV
jgi:translation initiation factor 3 subunit I